MANFWGYFEKPHSYVKTAVATYAVTFGNIWPFLLQYLVTLYAINQTDRLSRGIDTIKPFLLEVTYPKIMASFQCTTRRT